MELHCYENIEDFRASVEPFLVQHEAENNLMLGIVRWLAARPEPMVRQPYLALIENEDEIVSAAIMTPPHNVVLSWVEDDMQQHAITLMIKDLIDHEWNPPGVLGPSSLAKDFAERWQATVGQSHRLNRAMRIFKLDAVNFPPEVSGRFRRAEETDRDRLIEWFAEFCREIDEEQTPDEVARTIDAHLSKTNTLQGLYLWEDGECSVSMAGVVGETPDGVRISLVYTPPDLRRRGYASACVAALSQRVLDAGRKFCFLFTDLANPTSNHIYTDIGYHPVCDIDEYRFID